MPNILRLKILNLQIVDQFGDKTNPAVIDRSTNMSAQSYNSIPPDSRIHHFCAIEIIPA